MFPRFTFALSEKVQRHYSVFLTGNGQCDWTRTNIFSLPRRIANLWHHTLIIGWDSRSRTHILSLQRRTQYPLCNIPIKMAGQTGLEPATCTSSTCCSTLELLTRKMVERQRLELWMLPSSADAVYPNTFHKW